MTWTVGDRVWLHAFGSFYAGTVYRVAKTRVHVEYMTGAGVVRQKAVRATDDRLIRPRQLGEERPAGTRQRGDGYPPPLPSR